METALCLPLTEVARRLAVSLKSARRLADSGKLRIVRVGRLVRVEEREVLRFLAAARVAAERRRKRRKAA